jgi:hypothetical protein
MKASLEFDLSDPEDERKYRLCNSAEDADAFIYDIGEQLRSWYNINMVVHLKQQKKP